MKSNISQDCRKFDKVSKNYAFYGLLSTDVRIMLQSKPKNKKKRKSSNKINEE